MASGLCQALDTAAGTSGAAIALFRWDGAGQHYQSYECTAPPEFGTDFVLAPDAGYFVRVGQAITWPVPAP